MRYGKLTVQNRRVLTAWRTEFKSPAAQVLETMLVSGANKSKTRS